MWEWHTIKCDHLIGKEQVEQPLYIYYLHHDDDDDDDNDDDNGVVNDVVHS